MLRRERRRVKRLPIRLDVELRPVSVQSNSSVAGATILTQITNVGPGGVMVTLPTEQSEGTRFWVSTRINGKRVEFYAIVRHISVFMAGTQMLYAHGLQITAALDTVMDEFDLLMKRYLKGESGLAGSPGANESDAARIGRGGLDSGGASLAN